MERYARQMAFSYIGREGQIKLLQSKVTIIGTGALGTVCANNLCRAGVGHIRMADRDYVELNNLQRQTLFTEEDARQRLPKVIAASNHLSGVNSEITLEPVITDVNPSNIERLIGGSDLVLDATDNREIRMLINEACHAYKIPWIYCGVLGAQGMTMNILPGDNNPCLNCFYAAPAYAPAHTCSTFGVLNMITGAIASAQTAEAVKILTGSDSVRRELLMMELWDNHISMIEIKKAPDCPVCVHGRYGYFGKAGGSYMTGLCGSGSVQVVPAEPVKVDFAALAKRLEKAGSVHLNQYTLLFDDGRHEITLFSDGRAIIKNAIDENNAKSLYTEYIGI